MQEDSLNLRVGSTVQLQLDGPEATPRHMVRVIGYLPRGSLVVTTPTVGGKVQIVRDGQKFNVRMLRGDSVVGFASQVLVSAMKPYPHLHLAYPKLLEQIVVRNSARVSTRIQCVYRNTKQPDAPENFHRAEIVDLSETGAKIASPIPMGETDEMIQLNFKISVLGQSETLSLVADLKNSMERTESNEKGKRMVYVGGVRFRAANRFQQVLLHAWVMEQVANAKNPMSAT